VITAGGARPGDRVLLTKAAGIEGTAILAHERARELVRALSSRVVGAARRLREQPGISVVPDAVIAARHGPSAMHDPTEGGIRAAVHEMAFASRMRFDVDLDKIPVLAPTTEICCHYGIDPLGLIGSGALLVTVRADRTASLLRAWARRGIPGHLVGSVARGRGVRAFRLGRRVEFPWLVRDEIITALGSARSRTRRLRLSPSPRGSIRDSQRGWRGKRETVSACRL
jgi:hydrogenase maturation factor